MDLSQIIPGLIEILWLDLILSGDNAVLAAVATRALPREKKRAGVMLGTLLFIALRIVLALALLVCVRLPGAGLIGAFILVVSAWFVAARGESGAPVEMAPRRSLSSALLACFTADAPVALINMLAIVAAARGDRPLVLFGLAIAIPMLALGSSQIVTILRKPPLLWAGVALLGWVAGQMAAMDSFVAASAMPPGLMRDFAPPVGAALTLLLAYVALRGRRAKDVNAE